MSNYLKIQTLESEVSNGKRGNIIVMYILIILSERYSHNAKDIHTGGSLYNDAKILIIEKYRLL